MNNELEEKIQQIKDDIKEKGFSYIVSICKNKEAIKLIEQYTNYLDQQKTSNYKYATSERLWFILNDIKEFPKCKNCNKILDNPKSFLSIKSGFREYCNLKCATSSNLRTQHIKDTTYERSGYTSNFKNPAIRKRMEETNLKKTLEEKQNIIEKRRQTRFKNNDGQWHANDFGDKCKDTLLKRHGDKNWHNYEKVKETLLKKYGVSCSFNIKQVEEKSAIAIKTKSYQNILASDYDIPLFSLDDYIENHSLIHEFSFKCKKCGNIFKSIHRDGMHRRCPICYPKIEGTSNEEKEVIQYIEQITKKEDIILNSRKIINPLELDLYSKKHNIAIEFDGLYWHSELEQQNNDYHLNKTNLCEQQGIHLIHIFEDEWICKKAIVKSRLKSLFGIHDNVVFARKCEVKEVDAKSSREFQDRTHIQGSVNAKVNLGLFHDDKLIALMTFGKSRFNKKYEWELLRFCTELGYHIPGGAGKLLKHFERNYNPKSLISYADRRWSQGKLYKALGFQLESISKPNYWYLDSNNSFMRFSRVKFQKHKLKRLLENYDEKLSEVENMRNNGYTRIFDCGNYVFVKEYDESK